MAIANVKVLELPISGKKLQIWKSTFTSVTGGEIKTGLNVVDGGWYMPQTSDDHGVLYKNSASASATEDDWGSFYVDGVTSNDVGFTLVIGS